MATVRHKLQGKLNVLRAELKAARIEEDGPEICKLEAEIAAALSN